MILKKIQQIFKKFNIGITTYEKLRLLKEFKYDYGDLSSLSRDRIYELIELYPDSKSQLSQDLFVLHELNFKKDGFFVEFGATNGIDFSNTHILEKKFNWTGILAEPARHWHHDLIKNRSCHIEKNCVWIDSDTSLKFNESSIKELSTINQFVNTDIHHDKRVDGNIYDVKSISLEDLLDKYKAPKIIDYLSIDTEGSEYEILSNFDFSKYTFRIISCEHNYTESREKIKRLLEKNGYQRKFQNISQWDD